MKKLLLILTLTLTFPAFAQLPVTTPKGAGFDPARLERVHELVRSHTAGTFYWSGAATTHFFCDPKEGLLALVFCQHVPFDQHGLFAKFRTAVYQALE
jgi:CubicO group peptidase (beta-lactamase class C family)